MINVVLADDHALIRQGLKMLLSQVSDIKVTGEAGHGNGVLDLIATGATADVILADIVMPDMNGIQLAERISEQYPNIAVVILTVKDDDQSLHYSFRAGIRGYLLKTADMTEIEFAIRQAAKGKPYICSDLTERVMGSLAAVTPKNRSNVEFGEREMEILLLIAQGFTNQQIADKLFTSKRTVEGHRFAMLTKTGTNNAAELIRFAMREGIID